MVIATIHKEALGLETVEMIVGGFIELSRKTSNNQDSTGSARRAREELVATLEHPNGWHRDTAARLFYERQDKSALPALDKILTNSKSPLGRLMSCMLWMD